MLTQGKQNSWFSGLGQVSVFGYALVSPHNHKIYEGLHDKDAVRV